VSRNGTIGGFGPSDAGSGPHDKGTNGDDDTQADAQRSVTTPPAPPT
jgi:hypothetical protein